MAYSQEQDEQDLLQQMMGQPQSGTMPVGAAARFQVEPQTPEGAAFAAANPLSGQPAAGPAMPQDNGVAARKALGGYNSVGTMRGFNTAMDYGDDKAANSVKNTFGRIASRYKNAPSSVDAVMADPDFKRYFPNAKKISGGAGDKIDFGGVLSDFESGVPVGVVDVLGAADPNADTSVGWTWQDEANDGGGGGMAMGGGDPLMALLGGQGGGPPSVDALGQSDVLSQILEALAAQGGNLDSLLGGR